jgi:hypothetical protein
VTEEGYLTFDEVDMGHSHYQGLLFMWGSLVGVSPRLTGTHPSQYAQLTREWNDAPAYYPVYSGGSFSGKFASSKTSARFNTWLGIPYATTATMDEGDYAALQGDICKYLSSIGIVKQQWRLPTQAEIARSNASVAAMNWGDENPWENSGIGNTPHFNGNLDDGTALVEDDWGNPIGAKLTDKGNAFFPAGGHRMTSGRDNFLSPAGYSNNDGIYWTSTSSAHLARNVQITSGYMMTANFDKRNFYSVRCLRVQ